MDRLRLEQAAKSGARWFYWVAGLSALNSLAVWLRLGWSFSIGLGLTQVIDAFGSQLGTLGAVSAVVLDLVLVCVFAAMGYLAQSHRPAYVVGGALYALDALLVLAFHDVLGAGFHVFALFFITQGYRATRTLAAAVEPDGDVSASIVVPLEMSSPRSTVATSMPVVERVAVPIAATVVEAIVEPVVLPVSEPSAEPAAAAMPELVAVAVEEPSAGSAVVPVATTPALDAPMSPAVATPLPRSLPRLALAWVMLVLGVLGCGVTLLFILLAAGELFADCADTFERIVTAVILLSPLAVGGIMVFVGVMLLVLPRRAVRREATRFEGMSSSA